MSITGTLLSPTHLIGRVLVEFAGALPGNPIENNRDLSCRHIPERKPHMSAILKRAALAAGLAVVSVHGAASARGNVPGSLEQRSNLALSRFQAKIPSGMFGAINGRAGTPFGRSSSDVVFGGRILGRDPDPNVRLEILRERDLYAF
jgi:hypothetical protein